MRHCVIYTIPPRALEILEQCHPKKVSWVQSLQPKGWTYYFIKVMGLQSILWSRFSVLCFSLCHSGEMGRRYHLQVPNGDFFYGQILWSGCFHWSATVAPCRHCLHRWEGFFHHPDNPPSKEAVPRSMEEFHQPSTVYIRWGKQGVS